MKQLQEAQTIITNTIVCSVCGGTGHLSQDCKERRYVSFVLFSHNLVQLSVVMCCISSMFILFFLCHFRPGDSFRGMTPADPNKSAADKAKMDIEVRETVIVLDGSLLGCTSLYNLF